jgi:hypothetical protein
MNAHGVAQFRFARRQFLTTVKIGASEGDALQFAAKLSQSLVSVPT